MSYQFPIFRRYKHGNTFYRINSVENFDELMIIGMYFVFTNHQANILPEYQMIIDLLDNAGNRLENIDVEVFEAKLDFCKKNLKEKKF